MYLMRFRSVSAGIDRTIQVSESKLSEYLAKLVSNAVDVHKATIGLGSGKAVSFNRLGSDGVITFTKYQPINETV